MSVKFLNSNTALGSRVAVGVSALVGPTGPYGPTGPSNPGVQGYQGIMGIQGYQGIVGPTGVGPQGLVGSTGAFGLQGVQGIAGAAVGSLANVKLSYTRTTDSQNFSNAGNKLYVFSGATGGINNTSASNIIFTPSNGRFTVSEQGDYYFDARLILKGINNPDFITTDVYVNTGTVYNYTHVAYGIVSPVAFPIGLYLPLNAGDYVNIACYSTGTAGPINIKAGTTMNMFRITNGPTGSFGATASTTGVSFFVIIKGSASFFTSSTTSIIVVWTTSWTGVFTSSVSVTTSLSNFLAGSNPVGIFDWKPVAIIVTLTLSPNDWSIP